MEIVSEKVVFEESPFTRRPEVKYFYVGEPLGQSLSFTLQNSETDTNDVLGFSGV